MKSGRPGSSLKLHVVFALVALTAAASSCGSLTETIDPHRQLFAAFKSKAGDQKMAEPSLVVFDDTGRQVGIIELPRRREWQTIDPGPGGKLLLIASKSRGDRTAGKTPSYSIAAVDTKNLKVTAMRDFKGYPGEFGPHCQGSLLYKSDSGTARADMAFSVMTGKQTTRAFGPLDGFNHVPSAAPQQRQTHNRPVLCLGDQMLVQVISSLEGNARAARFESLELYEIDPPENKSPRTGRVIAEPRRLTPWDQESSSFTPSTDGKSFFTIETQLLDKRGNYSQTLVKRGAAGELWRKQILAGSGGIKGLRLGRDHDGQIEILNEWHRPLSGFGVVQLKEETKSEIFSFDSTTGARLQSTAIGYGEEGEMRFADDGSGYLFSDKTMRKFDFGKTKTIESKVELPFAPVRPTPVLP